MMLKLASHVVVAGLQFNGVTSATITSSWDQLTDTATLQFPRHAWFRGKRLFAGPNALIRRSNAVAIDLGYDNRLHPQFRGYVRSVSTGVPVSIECEDSMFLLKTTQINQSWRSVTLKELLTAILPPSIPFQAPDVNLGPFRIERASVAQVLEQIRKTYTLKSFFRDGKLYVGLAYPNPLQTRHKIYFDRHVPAGAGDGLEWRERDDVRIKLKAIIMRPDNSKEEFEFGDSDGELRTLHFYDVPASDVKGLAEAEMERLRYSGYRGDLEIFGEPNIQHGDIVELFDKFAPERNGAYLVKTVFKTFGEGGFRQNLTLETRVS